MKIQQIKNLRPTFKFGGMTMVEWFDVIDGNGYFSITSGLRHADGITKSPYEYSHFLCGKDSRKKCIEHFTKWWELKQKEEVNG